MLCLICELLHSDVLVQDIFQRCNSGAFFSLHIYRANSVFLRSLAGHWNSIYSHSNQWSGSCFPHLVHCLACNKLLPLFDSQVKKKHVSNYSTHQASTILWGKLMVWDCKNSKKGVLESASLRWDWKLVLSCLSCYITTGITITFKPSVSAYPSQCHWNISGNTSKRPMESGAEMWAVNLLVFDVVGWNPDERWCLVTLFQEICIILSSWDFKDCQLLWFYTETVQTHIL